MNEIMIRLSELEENKESIKKEQARLREQMTISDKEEYLEKELVYIKNNEKLRIINEKITILNNALDILENIG